MGIARSSQRVRYGIRFGFRCALVYSAVACVVVLAGGERVTASYHTTLPLILGAYLVAGVAVGALGGWLLPLAGTLPGTVLLGALCGIPTFWCFALAMDPPSAWLHASLGTACILGGIVGPVAAIMLRHAIRNL